MQTIMTLICMTVIFFTLPLLFKIKDLLYKRHNLIKRSYEEPSFCSSFFLALFAIGFYTNDYFFYYISCPFLAYLLAPIVQEVFRRLKR